MTRISRIFYRFNVQILYMLMLPFSFLVFALIYQPFDLDEWLDMGRGMFAFNITMLSCIVLLTYVITRFIFYFLRHHLDLSFGWYIFWCCMEVVVVSHFVTLYMWLMLGNTAYLEVLGRSTMYLAFILVFPYVIIGLCLRNTDIRNSLTQEPENTRIRFCDDKDNLKLVVQAANVLYISAEENYVHIFFVEKDKAKTFVLRNSMKNLEELCQKNGLIRCHRSYFVNKDHVKSLRKEKDGIILAELDSTEKFHIPVSKRYYDSLAALL